MGKWDVLTPLEKGRFKPQQRWLSSSHYFDVAAVEASHSHAPQSETVSLVSGDLRFTLVSQGSCY